MFKFEGKRKAEKRYSLFETWLDGVLSTIVFPPEVRAFNFNIYTGAAETYELELIAAPGFDPNDEDWACEELFASDLLAIPITADNRDWDECLADILGMVQRYLQHGLCRQVLLGRLAVGVGHVSGSLVLAYLADSNAEAEEAFPEEADRAFEEAPEAAEAPADAEEPAVACYKLIREMRPRAILCRPKREYGIRQYELLRGEVFERWNDEFTFQYQAEKGDVPTDLLYNTMGWLLVSGRLRAALEEMGAEVEFFPVRVEEAHSGQEQPGYWVANVLCKQDALCPEASEYMAVENEVLGSYQRLKRPALRRSALAGADIFKLPNHQEIPVFVTERFKKRMEKAGFSGLAYFPVGLV